MVRSYTQSTHTLRAGVPVVAHPRYPATPLYLFLIAGAFAISFPLVSLVTLLIAGTIAIAAGLSSEFSDLAIWGFVALALAVMSYFGHREKQRRRAEQQRRVR